MLRPQSAAGRGASMPAAGLAAWQSDMAAAGQPAGEAAGTRRFLHARSARVSPSGGALAVLRFGCVSREARDGAADADGGLLRATSGMSVGALVRPGPQTRRDAMTTFGLWTKSWHSNTQ